jgi:hypothetical protein
MRAVLHFGGIFQYQFKHKGKPVPVGQVQKLLTDRAFLDSFERRHRNAVEGIKIMEEPAYLPDGHLYALTDKDTEYFSVLFKDWWQKKMPFSRRDLLQGQWLDPSLSETVRQEMERYKLAYIRHFAERIQPIEIILVEPPATSMARERFVVRHQM